MTILSSSKVSAFLSHILVDCTASSSNDPHGAVKSARKALRHLRACQAGIPDDEAKFPIQPYIAGVTSRAKTATAEARQCEEADPSCSASTLSNEEYASLLDAAMRFPDKQAIQRGQRLSKKAIDNLSRRRHLPLRIQALATDRCWPLKKALAVYELVMQRHSLSLAELQDAVRLSSPVRHPDAKGGKPVQSQHVNCSPGLPIISISQFAAWVQQATDDIVSMSISL
ncbi:TPA: hypothetical protein ACH3X3_006131 [Trebouxia sp. C0006]